MSEKNKRLLTIATIIVSLLPCILILQFPAVVNAKTVTLYLSAIAGYMGIVLLLWMYILGTKAVTAIVFTDIAPVLNIHKWLGKYGTIAIFLHPILITYSYGASFFFSIIPQLATKVERHILLGQIAFWILVFTWLVSFFLRKKMAFRPWKYLHYLAYVCIPFALLHVPDLGSQEQAHVVVKLYLLLLGLIFIAFSALKARSMLNLDRSPYTVVNQNSLPGNDSHIITVLPGKKRLNVPARGQYIYIKLGYVSEEHPFSVVKYNKTTGEITLAYRATGMYTNELAKLQSGNTVLLSGPFGSFMNELVEDDFTPIVYLAGGIGITPFVDRILTDKSTRDQWLFAANRNRDTEVLMTPLKKQLGKHCVCVYSRASPPLQTGEEDGYINAKLLQKYLSDPLKYRYYLCGPLPMMDGARRALAALGVNEKNIFSEEFGW